MGLPHILQQYFLLAWLGFKSAISNGQAWQLGYQLAFLLPMLGALGLAVGFLLGLRSRNAKLSYFLIPLLLVEAYLDLPQWLPRKPDRHESTLMLLGFMALEVLAIALALLKGGRSLWPAIGLAVFCVTLTLYIGFVGGLSLSTLRI